TPDELARRQEDAEVDEVGGLPQARQPMPLRLEREERVVTRRLPRIQERPVPKKQLEQRLGVGDLELPDADAQLEYSNGAKTECRPLRSKLMPSESTLSRSFVAIEPSFQM